MQIFVSIGTVGASPQIGEMPRCDFFDCVVFQRMIGTKIGDLE